MKRKTREAGDWRLATGRHGQKREAARPRDGVKALPKAQEPVSFAAVAEGQEKQ